MLIRENGQVTEATRNHLSLCSATAELTDLSGELTTSSARGNGDVSLMLTSAHIRNYKSVADLKLDFTRLTVLIGENGSGKSNILEALALAAAAVGHKLDSEFLAGRGIRVTNPSFMRSAFAGRSGEVKIFLDLYGRDDEKWTLGLEYKGEEGYAELRDTQNLKLELSESEQSLLIEVLTKYSEQDAGRSHKAAMRQLLKKLRRELDEAWVQFLIYSPEHSALRVFEREGQILPLGIKGEGLFKLLKILSGDNYEDRFAEVRKQMNLLDWYEDMRIAPELAPFEQTLQVRDRYVSNEYAYFDQRSANEGFLFLLFYFTLMVSPQTPSCFAIDNIDASLNPKLCAELIRRLAVLAKKYDKQVILTTHNPAILDGLDLHDEEQQLLVVYRNTHGHTRTRRVSAPVAVGDDPPLRLSEAFIRGLLGGLPQNF